MAHPVATTVLLAAMLLVAGVLAVLIGGPVLVAFGLFRLSRRDADPELRGVRARAFLGQPPAACDEPGRSDGVSSGA